jgi:hypothetical protein
VILEKPSLVVTQLSSAERGSMLLAFKPLCCSVALSFLLKEMP